MAVSTTNAVSGPYVANGSTTAFPFTFKCLTVEEVRVTITVASVETEESSSSYSVTMNTGGNGGTVTFDVAPATGDIRIYSEPEFTQETGFASGQAFSPSVVNEALDRATVRDQYILRKINALLDEFDAGIVGDVRSDLASTASGKGVDLVARAVVAPKPQDYSAVGNGSTDDTTPISTLDALTAKKYLPAGTYDTTLASTALNGPFWGEGRVVDNSTNKRAPWFTAVKAAPSSFGTHDSAETAFNGDLSKVLLPIEARITGASTLSQPTSGYVYTPEAYPIYAYLYNSSGWNNSTSGNGGRTAAVFQRVKVYQAGQGDAVAYNASVFVTGARAGATHFLANPAGVIINGDMTAGQAGVYLNPREIVLHDASYDVAAIGDVINLDRNNATGALSCWWAAYRVQSIGSVAANNILSAVGKLNTGIDFSMPTLDFGTNKAAISLKGNDRIYFNNSSSNEYYTTAFNGWYLEYNTGLTGYQFVANGTSAFQITAAQVSTLFAFKQRTYTVATLPSSPTSGLECYVSDANATTRLSIVAGGGANFVKVFYNGTNWLIQ